MSLVKFIDQIYAADYLTVDDLKTLSRVSKAARAAARTHLQRIHTRFVTAFQDAERGEYNAAMRFLLGHNVRCFDVARYISRLPRTSESLNFLCFDCCRIECAFTKR